MPEGQPTPERFQTPRRMSESIIRLVPVDDGGAADNAAARSASTASVASVAGMSSEGVDPPSPRQA